MAFFAAGGVFLSSAQAEELTTPEIQLEIGYSGVASMGGCCKSSSPLLLGGLTLDMPRMFHQTDVEFRGVSTGKYSEISVGPRLYLLGSAPELAPEFSSGTRVSRVDQHLLLSSAGVGLASHSTRTVEYDLPALVGSFMVYGRLNYVFSLSERWAIGTVASVSMNVAVHYFSFVYSMSVGPRYKF